jgi:hypothetical protein
MITNTPGVAPIDDSIAAGQPGGPPPIVPAGGNSPPTLDPVAATVVPFADALPGTWTPPTDPTLTPI